MIAILQPIPDHLQEGLSVLFVGYNPSIRSSQTGHHYANPSNRFWKVMFRCGLMPRLFASNQGDELLALGFGFTNIVARPTRTAAEITKEEYEEGRELLRTKLAAFRPKAACFVGKGVYEAFSGKRGAAWGFQSESEETVAGVREFIGPSTSGLVRLTVEQMADIYAELAAWKRRYGYNK